jgi:tRNA dimethylallyltransferase
LNNQTVIIIAGPTAVGKTAAAIRLAQELHTRIISADSRQCFRELNIGVAKPSVEELQTVHHYFINSHSIQDEVNAAIFEELALQWTAEIFRDRAVGETGWTRQAKVHGHAGWPDQQTAVMVGGTGLYIKAFCEGLDEMPAIDPAIRQQVQAQYDQEGMSWLQQQVRQHDGAFYAAGEMLNPQRLMRALEVKLSTGRSVLSFRTRGKKSRPFHIQKIGLHLPKEQLHERIHARVDKMMEQGLWEEVKSLAAHRDRNALFTVGYSELFACLDGKCSLDEAVDMIKKNTRHYAKRQMTWFRKDPAIQWVDANEFGEDPLRFMPGR